MTTKTLRTYTDDNHVLAAIYAVRPCCRDWLLLLCVAVFMSIYYGGTQHTSFQIPSISTHIYVYILLYHRPRQIGSPLLLWAWTDVKKCSWHFIWYSRLKIPLLEYQNSLEWTFFLHQYLRTCSQTKQQCHTQSVRQYCIEMTPIAQLLPIRQNVSTIRAMYVFL